MTKVRIVERTLCDGAIVYDIQQQHFLFRWWSDARICARWTIPGLDIFDTLDEAKKNLCCFDGT